jgi:hypothetical protein
VVVGLDCGAGDAVGTGTAVVVLFVVIVGFDCTAGAGLVVGVAALAIVGVCLVCTAGVVGTVDVAVVIGAELTAVAVGFDWASGAGAGFGAATRATGGFSMMMMVLRSLILIPAEVCFAEYALEIRTSDGTFFFSKYLTNSDDRSAEIVLGSLGGIRFLPRGCG